MIRSRALFLVFATALPLVGAAYTSGCSTEDPAAAPAIGGDVGGGGAAALDPCADPTHVGCPCSEEGTIADCGMVKQKSGDFVLCSQGTASCTEGKWSECKGDHEIIKSQSVHTLTGEKPGVVTLDVSPPAACVANPCNPSCQVIADNSTGVPTVDGGPIPNDAGGFTLPQNVVTNECSGLQCFLVQCPGNGTTSITGKVYDPAGLRPVMNAIVMIPNGPVTPLSSGVTGTSDCASNSLPKAMSYAFTAADGSFTLTNVPVKNNLPILIQIGRWRREFTVNPTMCGNLALPLTQTRLPQTAAEGNIPKIALRTANCDPFECLLKRIGIATSEFTNPSGSGRVHIYRSSGGTKINSSTPDTGALMDNYTTLDNYDLVMLPCDCGSEYGSQSATRRGNLQTFANAGGRVFTSHWGREWIEHTSWNFVAQWYGGASCGDYGCKNPLVGHIDTTFARGAAFQQWMNAVGITGSTFNISPQRIDVRKLLSNQAIRWVYGWSDNNPAAHPSAPDAIADFTFDTPVNIPDSQKLGRVMYTDMHLSEGSGNVNGTFPNNCFAGTNLSAQEKAAEYLLFDLGGCVGAEDPIDVTSNYSPATLTRDYSATCPVGKRVQWRLFNWKTSLPTPPMGVTTANIHFDVQTAETAALLPSATQVSLADAIVSNPTTWMGADVAPKLAAANILSGPHLRVTMNFNPSSDGKQAPSLLAWEQMFDCVDSE